MYRHILLLIGVLCTGFLSAQPSPSMKVATYNIRIRTDVDTGAISWEHRKYDVARVVTNHGFELFGVQEMVDSAQMADLAALLSQYDRFTFGRNNQEGTKGERVGLFFSKSRFEPIKHGFFFLSPTPDVMSKGWDAALKRICIWQQLRDKRSGQCFFVFSAHFDHKGVVARVESARLIIRKVNEIAGKEPVIFLGDLNANREESEMYKVLTGSLQDACVLSRHGDDASKGTFNGFDVTKTTLPATELIDYIFCNHFRVDSYKVLNDKFRKEAYPSDHFPVMIECSIIP